MHLLELKNARLVRGEQQLFGAIDLAIPCDCNTVILGPNGSGKSSLLKLITRELYIQPDEGARCLLLGRENWNLTELRERMRVVSHELQLRLFDDSTGLMAVLSGIYDSVTTWAHQDYNADDFERARYWMRFFGVADLENRVIAQMSTGQQRRLLLARAMVTEPDYLVLDEPGSALDVAARTRLLKLLASLMQRGHHVLMVTHQIEEVLPGFKHLIMLREGAVFATGSPGELLTSERVSGLYGMPLEVRQDEYGWHCRSRETI